MNFAQATAAVKTQMQSAWPALSGSVPFVFDNTAVDQVAEYARLWVMNVSSEQQTFGQTRKYRRNVLVRVKLNVMPDGGEARSLALTDAVKQCFEGKRMGDSPGEEGVVGLLTSWRRIGTDGQYFTVQVDTTAYFIELRAPGT